MTHPLLQQLKQETSAQHQLLEQELQLLRPDLSRSAYRLLLEAFYGFYAPWEQRAIPLLNVAAPAFFEGRQKVPLLQLDLQFLGSDLLAIPITDNLPDMSSLPSLLGSLYVLEGATLGGQILTRHLKQQFLFSDVAGCRFFSSYGEAVGSRWKAFCLLLTSLSSPHNDILIVDAAKATFTSLTQWLLSRTGRISPL